MYAFAALKSDPISGKTSASYLVGQADVGRLIKVKATYTDGEGNEESSTTSFTVIGVNAPGTYVSNISVAQRATTKLVDINYDVGQSEGNLITITVEVSDDGGATYAVSAQSFSGDIGAGILTGAGKKVVWNAGEDWDGNISSNMRFRITATVE